MTPAAPVRPRGWGALPDTLVACDGHKCWANATATALANHGPAQLRSSGAGRMDGGGCKGGAGGLRHPGDLGSRLGVSARHACEAMHPHRRTPDVSSHHTHFGKTVDQIRLAGPALRAFQPLSRVTRLDWRIAAFPDRLLQRLEGPARTQPLRSYCCQEAFKPWLHLATISSCPISHRLTAQAGMTATLHLILKFSERNF